MNPLMRPLVARGRTGDQVMLLHVIGRRSGRLLEIVCGRHQIEGRTAVLTNSPWRLNFRGGRDCELVIRGVAHRARGELVEDAERVGGIYDRIIGELGVRPAQRRLGIRINADRRPTLEELQDAVRSTGLSIIFFDLGSEVPEPAPG